MFDIDHGIVARTRKRSSDLKVLMINKL